MEFCDGDKHGDIFIRTVEVNTEVITPDDATEEEKELIMKKRYIAVYNPDREKYDLDDIDEKAEAVRKKLPQRKRTEEFLKVNMHNLIHYNYLRHMNNV